MPRSAPRRRLGCALAGILLLVAAGTHWRYWYGERWHALPVAEARLLPRPADGASSLWVPFPHQNLAALEAALEDPGRVLAAAGRLAGRDDVALPRLRPFGVPPAREASIDWHEGEEPAAALALYPTVRWLVRGAGVLAGNPWLAGGVVGDQRVTWSAGVWRVAPADAARPAGSDPVPLPGAAETAPIWLRWRQGRTGETLPPGVYDLTMREGSLRLGPPGQGLAAPALDARGVVLILDRRDGTRLLALARGSAVRLGPATLPALLSLAPDEEAARELLPAGDWLGKILELPTERIAAGVAVATEEPLLPLARELTSSWLPWMEAEGLAVVAVLRPAPAAELADGIADFLDDFPLTSRNTRQRWRDAATVLEALKPFEEVLVAGGGDV